MNTPLPEEERRLWRRFAAACMGCGRVREIPDDAPIEPWMCPKCTTPKPETP